MLEEKVAVQHRSPYLLSGNPGRIPERSGGLGL